jgi:hypothetical protein
MDGEIELTKVTKQTLNGTVTLSQVLYSQDHGRFTTEQLNTPVGFTTDSDDRLVTVETDMEDFPIILSMSRSAVIKVAELINSFNQ